MRRERVALRMIGCQLDERQEDRQADQRRQEQPCRPAQEPAVREPRRDERAGQPGIGEVVDPGQPRALRLVGREAGHDVTRDLLGQGPVDRITRIDERRGRVEAMARLDLHEPRSDAGVDLEHARERDLATESS